MSIKVPTNRFIVSSLRAGFYQQLFRSLSGFHQLGQKLIKEIEVAQAFRQISRVDEIGSVLSGLPIKEHQLIGQYYQGMCIQHIGENAKDVFEMVADQSLTYKTRALMSLAGIEGRKGKYDEELRYIAEAYKTTNNPTLIVELSRGTAMVRANEGDHKQAVKEFERTFPLIKSIKPVSYYQYLNSFAVELAEVGRLEEASNICDVLLASPYAFAYPEWRETAEEIRLKLYRSRSVVSVSQVIPQNVVSLPERSVVSEPVKQPGKLLHYTDWIKKMVKEPNGEELPGDMTPQDMALRLVELITENKEEDEKLREILDFAIKIFSKK
jgi:hypothetical protein